MAMTEWSMVCISMPLRVYNRWVHTCLQPGRLLPLAYLGLSIRCTQKEQLRCPVRQRDSWVVPTASTPQTFYKEAFRDTPSGLHTAVSGTGYSAAIYISEWAREVIISKERVWYRPTSRIQAMITDSRIPLSWGQTPTCAGGSTLVHSHSATRLASLMDRSSRLVTQRHHISIFPTY